MLADKINNNTNFQAKLLVNDARVEKFIRHSYLHNSPKAYEAMDKLNKVHPNTLLSARIAGFEDEPKLVIRNMKNQKAEYIDLNSANIVTKKDNNAFYNLLKRLLDESKKSIQEFWA
jgi:hypothetical protein